MACGPRWTTWWQLRGGSHQLGNHDLVPALEQHKILHCTGAEISCAAALAERAASPTGKTCMFACLQPRNRIVPNGGVEPARGGIFIPT